MSFSIDGKSWDDYKSSTLTGEEYNLGERGPFGKDLYDYSFGQVRDAAAALGIKNVNSYGETDRILERIRNPVSAQPPPPPAAPTPPPEPEKPPQPAFDDRLDTIKNEHQDTVRDLTDQINSQRSQYEDAMRSMQDMFNSQLGDFHSAYDNKMSHMSQMYDNQMNTMHRDYQSQIGGLSSQLGDLNKQIESYQKSYNPTTVVGTSAKATGFNVPESSAGQMGIKSKGTSQFNRSVRNNLKISGVNL